MLLAIVRSLQRVARCLRPRPEDLERMIRHLRRRLERGNRALPFDRPHRAPAGTPAGAAAGPIP